jgi:VanZ family protein
MPGEKMPETGDLFSFDKIAHTAVFCVLTFLTIIGFSKQFKYQKLRNSPLKYSVLLCAIYASTLEVGQAMVPDRYANFFDLAFNMLGVLMGYVVFMIVYKLSFV